MPSWGRSTVTRRPQTIRFRSAADGVLILLLSLRLLRQDHRNSNDKNHDNDGNDPNDHGKLHLFKMLQRQDLKRGRATTPCPAARAVTPLSRASRTGP